MSSTNYTTNLGLPQFADSDIPTWGDINSAFAKVDLIVGAIAPKFDAAATYEKGDYVQYEAEFYKAKADISTAGAWDSTKWDKVVITTAMQDEADLTDFVKVDMTSGAGVTATQYAHLSVVQ